MNKLTLEPPTVKTVDGHPMLVREILRDGRPFLTLRFPDEPLTMASELPEPKPKTRKSPQRTAAPSGRVGLATARPRGTRVPGLP